MKKSKNKQKRIVGEITNKRLVIEQKREIANLSRLAVNREKTSETMAIANANAEFTKRWYEQFSG